MIELIKIFVVQAYQILDINSFITKRKRSNSHGLGSELLVLYTGLNGLYIAGSNTVEELQKLQRQASRYVQESRETQVIMSHKLAEMLNRQSVRLKMFAEAFQRLVDIMNIGDPETSREMSFFLSGKINLINYVSMILTSSNTARYAGLAFSRSTENNFIAVVQKFQKSGLKNTDQIDSRGPDSFSSQLSTSLDQAEKINKYSEVTLSEIEIIKNYLEQADTSKYLVEIKTILFDLYSILTKHFKVEDVLLKAGDSRGEGKEFFI